MRQWSEFSRVNLFLHELPGIEPIVSVARVYKDNSSSHVLGYVSQVSAKDLKNKNKKATIAYPARLICDGKVVKEVKVLNK